MNDLIEGYQVIVTKSIRDQILAVFLESQNTVSHFTKQDLDILRENKNFLKLI